MNSKKGSKVVRKPQHLCAKVKFYKKIAELRRKTKSDQFYSTQGDGVVIENERNI